MAFALPLQVQVRIDSKSLHDEPKHLTAPITTACVNKNNSCKHKNKHYPNADITSLCKNGLLKRVMGRQGNIQDYATLLQACIANKALEQGKQVHGHIILTGLEQRLVLRVKLVTMYAMCGSIVDARLIFEELPFWNVFLWTAMISGYVKNELFQEAIQLYSQMQWAAIQPDNFTFSCVLKACAGLSALQQGKQIHNHIIRLNGVKHDVAVENALVIMYSQCGRLDIARQVFDKISERNVVSWNSMISGYAQNGYPEEALQLFREMQCERVEPNWITVTALLPACGYVGVVRQGKEIHAYVIKSEIKADVLLGNALIDMYAKCGSIEIACKVFDEMPTRDLVSWNTVIAGQGINGRGAEAVRYLYRMQEDEAGLKPDSITFISLLSACSHAGLVEEGWRYFKSMSRDYDIIPEVEHYACMVDLLGRAGRVEEAHKFIQEMPLEPSSSVWGSLLSACRIHCNVDLGEGVAERLFEMEPQNAGNYILLSNIYAAAGRWEDVAKVRSIMKEQGIKKRPGCSWIEVNNRVHAFVAGDQSAPQLEEIYAMLESLDAQMKAAGYLPATDFVLHDVEDDEKEAFLCGHSEKLAIAFGLINTHARSPLQITKNIRVCGDCHNAIKFISKIVEREIIVRDTNRFHHVRGGNCSCGDYW